MPNPTRAATPVLLLAVPLTGLLAAPAAADVHVFDAIIDGSQIIPPTNSPGSGWAIATIDDVSGYVHVIGAYQDLLGPVVEMHLHGPGDGTPNGGTLLYLDNDGGTAGTFEGDGILEAEDIPPLLKGFGYVNIHTTTHQGGEIRGDLGPAPVEVPFPLDGDQVVPPVSTAGEAEAVVTIDPDTRQVTVVGSYQGLSSAARGAELRGPARPGENGKLLVTLSVSGGSAGRISGGGQVKNKNLPAVLGGGAYLVVQSMLHPDGELRGQVDDGTLGTGYCTAEANSTGQPGRIQASGSLVVGDGDLTLSAFGLPPGEMAYFLTSQTSGQVLPLAGSIGRLCLAGGPLGRFVDQAGNSGALGSLSIHVDLTRLPLTPPVAALPGDTWNFQCWHRDGSGSNFTDAVSLTFL